MNKVFLGGTCADSTWRDNLVKVLDVAFFNPVVDDWTPECQKREEVEKLVHCNIHLYVITCDMIGAFSIAEAIESAHRHNKNTILHIMPFGFSNAQIKSFRAIVDIVIRHGGIAYIDDDLNRTARLINSAYT